jgi:hypothetical protein
LGYERVNTDYGSRNSSNFEDANFKDFERISSYRSNNPEIIPKKINNSEWKDTVEFLCNMV